MPEFIEDKRRRARSAFGAAMILAAALPSVACTASPVIDKTPAYLFTPVFGSIGSMAFGMHSESFGVGVVEKATGQIFFCQNECSPIGKTTVPEPNALAVHSGSSNDFFVTNNLTGEVTSCSIELVNRKEVFVFRSGTCRAMRLRR
jgi:hypothetical protein